MPEAKVGSRYTDTEAVSAVEAETTLTLNDTVTIGGDQPAKIDTGTYTGDGTTSQAITGLGFQPKWVIVYRNTSSNVQVHHYEVTDQEPTGLSLMHINTGGHRVGVPNTLISLDSDGFTVDDGGSNSEPNTDGITYTYFALG